MNSKKEVPNEFKAGYNASLKSKINFLTKTDLEKIKDVRMLKIFRDSIRSHIQTVRLTPFPKPLHFEQSWLSDSESLILEQSHDATSGTDLDIGSHDCQLTNKLTNSTI